MKDLISLIISMLLGTLTVAAHQTVAPQSCRRGIPRPEQYNVLHRGAPNAQPKQAGGSYYHGELHQLTVLVSYNDRSFKDSEAATLAQWNKILNTRNLTEEPFSGSVHDYFYDQSYGSFSLTFDLQFVQVSGNAAKYASTEDDDENSQYLLQDIMQVLAGRDIDWSLYDWNGDGFINQLLIIYAGHSMSDTPGGGDLIWPHQWWMSDHRKDRQPGVYCNPIPVSYSGKDYMIDCYCAVPELTNKNDYGSFGTLCHEFTHCFGFNDLYYGRMSYLGSWDLMDIGNYNGNGFCPVGYSAHERWIMGWLTPTELTNDTTVTGMPALIDVPQAYLIRNDGYPNEYYIVENRQMRGWDAGIPGNGVIVFHIDFDPQIWTSIYTFPNTDQSQHYLIIPANNNSYTSAISNWGYPYEGNNQLTHTSSPAATLWHAGADGTMLMNKSLTDIAVTDGLASFSFSLTKTGIKTPQTDSLQKSTILYHLGPIYIIRNAQGKVCKVLAPSPLKRS